MARNKRKNIKDQEKMKGLRIAAKKRWRENKKNLEKGIQNAFEEAGPSVSYGAPRDNSPDAAVVAGPNSPPSTSCKP